MSDDWNFGSMSLAGIEEDSGERRLTAGRYVVEVTEATLESVSTDPRGRRLQLNFRDVNGLGGISESLNVHLPSKPAATEIGKKHLRGLLVHGGHPTPDNPSDIATLISLRVGINVVSEPFIDKKGIERIGSSLDSWHPFFNPEGAVGLGPEPQTTAPTPPETTSSIEFDDIPFG